jgi:integrase
MKTKLTLFRRNGIYYSQDSTTGKQKSLGTRDETTARKLVEATNEAHRSPILNLQLARAYLSASDPAFLRRTWQTVMDQMQTRGRDSSRQRYVSAFRTPAFDPIRNQPLLETATADLLQLMKDAKPSQVFYLKCLHGFALSLGWISIPIVAPNLWPKHHPKARRGITLEEHQRLLTLAKGAEWRLYLELLWETGAAQTDAAMLKAEDIDWPARTITYFRKKTGTRAQITLSKKLETVLSHLPTLGALFPRLSQEEAHVRSKRFAYQSLVAGISDITLHGYRYAWAERANSAGMPERFAQAALGHSSTAVHHAYARKAIVIAPSLEDYENKLKPTPPPPSPTVTA